MQPNQITPLEHTVLTLTQLNELHIADTLLQTFLKYAKTPLQYDQLARLFHDIKSYPSAIQAAERGLALSTTSEQLKAFRSNLTKLYNHTNQPELALQYIAANLNQDPNDYEALMEKVFALYLAARHSEGFALIKQLINDPNAPDNVKDRCRFNLGTYLLENDQFQEGLYHFIDIGHQIGIWKEIKCHLKPWTGTIIKGQTIAILAEGGIGDEVINVRFMHHLQKLGTNPIFVTNRQECVSLFTRNNFNTVAHISQVPPDAVYVPAMYLPILLNLQPNELWYGPYLKPDPVFVEKWKQILPPGKKIGLRWKGNPHYEHDLHRSIPLSELDKRLDFSRTDLTFVSVQKDDYAGIENYPNIFNAAPYLDTLEDLLACLSLLDYTFSSCTSVAHIAAAADFPITVLPPLATYYVWLGTTKWYGDNCKVVRQTVPKSFQHLDQLVIN